MFPFPGLDKVLPQVTQQLNGGLARIEQALAPLTCVAKAAKCLVRFAQHEYGVLEGLDETRITPRRADQMPLILEAEAPGVTAEETFNLESQLGYVPMAGFYANLGSDEFQVILESMSGQVSLAHTVPAGTTIAITSLVSKITIRPVGGAPARYQVYAR
ncbi:MAG TPA: hypothetical protein VHN99_05915 [Deinococcales bacterium]|nr:hypothetical protein [Deinococcales bacterium]